MLAHVDVNVAEQQQQQQEQQRDEASIEYCLTWLEYADRYKLQRARQAFIDFVAPDRDLLDRKEYKAVKWNWGRALRSEVLIVAIREMEKQGKNKNRPT